MYHKKEWKTRTFSYNYILKKERGNCGVLGNTPQYVDFTKNMEEKSA